MFYYIYKPLAHPEYNNYIAPVTIDERLMHVEEAKRVLGTQFNWLADTMDNIFHEAMGQTPNSELVIDPEGVIVARRAWSDPAAVRADLERLVGRVENPTRIADLDMPAPKPAPTVTKGVVPRIEKPAGMWPIEIQPVLESTDLPFYVKARAEGEAGPVKFQLTAPPGVVVTPASGVGPDVDEPADADPREFLVDVTAETIDAPLGLDVFYFACDDALTFCIPVNQSYEIPLARDESHDWSIQTTADGPQLGGGPPGAAAGGARRGGGRGRPNFTSMDTNDDGRVSMDEAPGQMQGFFGQMDADGDGFISESEFQNGPGRAR